MAWEVMGQGVTPPAWPLGPGLLGGPDHRLMALRLLVQPWDMEGTGCCLLPPQGHLPSEYLSPCLVAPYALSVLEVPQAHSTSGQRLLDPADHACDARVDTEVVGPATAQAPADQSCQEPAAAGLPAHQWAPRVTLRRGGERKGGRVKNLQRQQEWHTPPLPQTPEWSAAALPGRQ